MGLGEGMLQEIVALKRASVLEGMTRVVEIGAQQLSNNLLRADSQLKEALQLFAKPTVPQFGVSSNVGHTGALELQSEQAPPSQAFWEALGFKYASIDFDGHRHSLPLDLNKDRVPIGWRSRFDLLVNAGTTEHVANQDNAFRVMHDLVRKRGIMIHELPAAGTPTHGMITYSIKFFWHLCRENNYEVLRLEMRPGATAPLPDNIIATNETYARDNLASRFQAEPIRDWTLCASLRKVNSAAYVTPLDLPQELMLKVLDDGRLGAFKRAWNRWRRP
jgi:hypothetical protein